MPGGLYKCVVRVCKCVCIEISRCFGSVSSPTHPLTPQAIASIRTNDLRHHRREGRASNAHPPHGDQPHVQDQVDEPRTQRHEQRGDRVFGAQERRLRHHGEEHGGRPDGADGGVLFVLGVGCWVLGVGGALLSC